MLITERQNREKTLPRRRKKEKKIKNILKAIETDDNDDTDDVDSQTEEDDDRGNINEMLASVDAETKEAVTVCTNIFHLSFDNLHYANLIDLIDLFIGRKRKR